MSFPMENLENFRIPLVEIKLATEEFHEKNKIASGEYSKLYRGQLSESRENRTAAFKRFTVDDINPKKEYFLNELKVIPNLNHDNIIPFLGYCHEGEEMIIVYDYPVYGSLANLLRNPYNRSHFTWQQRLLICYYAARGLHYLHSCLEQHGKVIHGCFMEDNILIGENFEAKICGFEISELIPSDQPRQQVYKPYKKGALRDHMDRIYVATGFLKEESDVYSFGVLLFRILTRPDPFYRPSTGEDSMPRSITMAVQHHFHNRLDSVIDPAIRDQIDSPSFRMIEEITRKCLSYNIKERPTMLTVNNTIVAAVLDAHNREANSVKGSHSEYRDPREFLIPFKEIELAMQMSKKSSLPPHVYSDLYTAELSERWPNRPVVLKVYNIISDWQSTDKFLKMEMFRNEREIVSRFHHENIIPYIGYCDEGGSDRVLFYEPSIFGDFVKKQNDNNILIYKQAINGSLHDHLQDPNKRCLISWVKRLQICLGAARGIKCLHSGLWEENRLVVHRQVRSKYILLDENMEAKISGFGLSMFVPRNNPQVYDNYWKHVERGIIRSSDYKKWELGESDIIDDFKASMDPIYKQSYIVNTEVDVYSFGLVMFEILSGSVLQRTDEETFFGLAMFEILSGVSQRTDEQPDLIRRVHRHYGENEMDKLIDPNIRDQIDGRSLQTFADTAYRCLSYNIKERPSMNRIVKKIEEALYFQKHKATDSTTTIPSQQYQKLEDLLIPLEKIRLATWDFSEENKIGEGGFGVVYKGQLSEQSPNHEVAIKRLVNQGKKVAIKRLVNQGKKEFLNEAQLIFKFHHQNIIPFIGYCDEGNEMILVFEYANKRSLDDHLEESEKMLELTWDKRLKICLGAAKGLEYLHSGLGEDNKVIHRDVKSGNILLDDNWEAKICDFGLSKSGLTYDHQHYTGVAGTDWYRDPVYHESGILRTESDVYSFGVVMFEMLSGMPAYRKRKIGDDKEWPLIKLVRRYYDSGKELLIDPQIKDQIDSNSFHTFVEIAYQCISFNSKERPSVETIIDKIEEALDFQEKKGHKQSD